VCSRIRPVVWLKIDDQEQLYRPERLAHLWGQDQIRESKEEIARFEDFEKKLRSFLKDF
jgi:hypothetical protein